jgi:gluconate 5-dehydrogenase
MAFEELFALKGKTAIVTGASSGLGVTHAETLVRAGANVVLAARRVEKLETLSNQLASEGGTTMVIRCDVGDPADVAAMVDAAWKRFGRVDVLVNNAGVAAEGGMMPERVPHDLFEQTVRVNLLGVWYGCREVGARMLADGKGGSIVNVASIAGLAALPDFPPAYHASKAAVINLTRSLACSWADRGIRVNALAPGWFPSELADPVLQIPSFNAWAANTAPMGRLGDPRELVGPLLFLASDASSFMTGQTLVIDGGAAATGAGGRIPADVLDIFARHTPDDRGKHIVPPV